ncbi:MAG TPA: hypothetical protein VHB98_05090 [Chloroflexota bacterium]|nr:hypothetical protein [Chloroflexota bacterium]
MDRENTLVARLQMHVARWLAKGSASPLILAGTLALAGLGAGALSGTPGGHGQQSPNPAVGTSAPTGNCHPDPDGDGHLVCYIDASQLPRYANEFCRPDPDGDGHFVCYIDSH